MSPESHEVILGNGFTQPSDTFRQQHEVFNSVYADMSEKLEDPNQDYYDRVIVDRFTGEPRLSFSLGQQHPDFGNGTGL